MNSERRRYQGMQTIPVQRETVQITRFSVGGLSCGACVRHITRALEGMSGVIHVDVDLQKNEAEVRHLAHDVDEASLVATIRDAGYQPKVLGSQTEPTAMVARRAPARRSAGCCCG